MLVYWQYIWHKKQKDKILSFNAAPNVPQLMDFWQTMHESRNVDVNTVFAGVDLSMPIQKFSVKSCNHIGSNIEISCRIRYDPLRIFNRLVYKI